MKSLKRVSALFSGALISILLSVPAFAAEPNADTGVVSTLPISMIVMAIAGVVAGFAVFFKRKKKNKK